MSQKQQPATVGPVSPGLGSLFASLGQTLLVLDEGFHVLDSFGLAEVASRERARQIRGQPVHEVLRAGLFGPGDAFRNALEAGEHRQGWRATVYLRPDRPQLVGVAAAPLAGESLELFGDQRVTYAVVLKPLAPRGAPGTGAPVIFCGLVGRSAAMLRLFERIQTLSDSTITVLITGESGTGKELVARALHRHSDRRQGPFVAVNCAAFPDTLLESELFGHVQGAFSGASRDRIGRFEQAGTGTLFLDEVGDLPLHLQVKLLRVLQERTFERLGENRSRRCDARFLAATHRDLRRAVENGSFRQDLYYRLRVIECHLPPLRERREDVEPLAVHLLGRIAARLGRPLSLAPDALGVLLRHPWPGNVRELENALEHAVSVGRRAVLEPDDLPPELLEETPAGGDGRWEAASAGGVDRSVAAPVPSPAAARRRSTGGPPDPQHLLATLQAAHWRRREAARKLGVNRTTLWRWMRELGLD